jgi:hypothetical protein
MGMLVWWLDTGDPMTPGGVSRDVRAPRNDRRPAVLGRDSDDLIDSDAPARPSDPANIPHEDVNE